MLLSHFGGLVELVHAEPTYLAFLIPSTIALFYCLYLLSRKVFGKRQVVEEEAFYYNPHDTMCDVPPRCVYVDLDDKSTMQEDTVLQIAEKEDGPYKIMKAFDKLFTQSFGEKTNEKLQAWLLRRFKRCRSDIAKELLPVGDITLEVHGYDKPKSILVENGVRGTFLRRGINGLHIVMIFRDALNREHRFLLRSMQCLEMGVTGETTRRYEWDVFQFDMQISSPVSIGTLLRNSLLENPNQESVIEQVKKQITKHAGKEVEVEEIGEDFILPSETNLDYLEKGGMRVRLPKPYLNEYAAAA